LRTNTPLAAHALTLSSPRCSIALGQFKNIFGYGASWAAGSSAGCCCVLLLRTRTRARCCARVLLLRAHTHLLHHARMQAPARPALTLQLRCRQGLHDEHQDS
jgi:hypothetical protein